MRYLLLVSEVNELVRYKKIQIVVKIVATLAKNYLYTFPLSIMTT
jgi:hypothetical protein